MQVARMIVANNELELGKDCQVLSLSLAVGSACKKELCIFLVSMSPVLPYTGKWMSWTWRVGELVFTRRDR